MHCLRDDRSLVDVLESGINGRSANHIQCISKTWALNQSNPNEGNREGAHTQIDNRRVIHEKGSQAQRQHLGVLPIVLCVPDIVGQILGPFCQLPIERADGLAHLIIPRRVLDLG